MITLPTVLTEDTWFYKKNKKVLKEHLGKPYISYSSSSSWHSYREDYIKSKFVGIRSEGSVYTRLGGYLGTAVETGKFPDENPDGFTGQENFKKVPRPPKAKYERFVHIDFGEFIFIGFIDIMDEHKKGIVNVADLKTGGERKEREYTDPKYTQVVLYAHALELEGYKIDKTFVWFVRRTGSHIKPPLHISDEQFEVRIPYNEKRVEYAKEKLIRSVEEISDCYKTYLRFF